MKKINLAYLLISCMLTMAIQAQESNNDEVLLSVLDLSRVEQPWWTAQKNKAITGEKIYIKGKRYKKGIGTLSNSKMYVFLDGKSIAFKAEVGIQDSTKPEGEVEYNVLSDGTKLFYTNKDDKRKFVGIGLNKESIKNGSVYFVIKGDGKTLWKSKKVKGGAKAIPVSVKVKGVKILELIVEDAGDGVSGDNAVWADAKLIYKDYRPQLVYANYLNKQQTADSYFVDKISPQIKALPLGDKALLEGVKQDWLIENIDQESKVIRAQNKKEIIISNGLISRTFRLTPNCATVGFNNLSTGESLLRGTRPEAIVTIDGKEYAVGGLEGQIEYAYLKKEWLDKMWSPEGAFQVQSFSISNIEERINWKNKRWSSVKKEAKKGKSLHFVYAHPVLKDILVTVHYTIYDGIPLISKWISVSNNGDKEIKLNSFKSEILAVVEAESAVEKQNNWETPNIHVESDYEFHSMSMKNANKVVHWEKDKRYTSQASYLLSTPCLLECKLPKGPNELIKKGGTYDSFRVWELPYSSHDPIRKGLATNQMYKVLAPWVTENPLFLHLTSTKESIVKKAIDQCVETGYEMVILSFGSGLNMEDNSPENIAKFKGYADYAHKRGIELGGYSLLSSRWISEEVDVINPETGKRGGTIHGSAPCLNSQWGIDYFKKITFFLKETGFDLLEHDGSYPGQYCASTKHVAHQGLEDSQWKSWKRITNFYKWCNENGISLNIPDWYYLSGSTKNGIGYREVNWSLPRERQLIIGRQNMLDGTRDRLPSMSWTFVPLSQYHGGGAAATIEPLNDHLDAYKAHMVQNYGMGVQACYRGARLYDTEKTKSTVIEVVDWYKKYRNILNSPIVGIKRADGIDVDGFIHVNPDLEEKGLAMFFNPTEKTITKTVSIPLYYAGLSSTATVSEKEGQAKEITLKRDYSIELEVSLKAKESTWFLIK